jgi:hypothetical protein
MIPATMMKMSPRMMITITVRLKIACAPGEAGSKTRSTPVGGYTGAAIGLSIPKLRVDDRSLRTTSIIKLPESRLLQFQNTLFDPYPDFERKFIS